MSYIRRHTVSLSTANPQNHVLPLLVAPVHHHVVLAAHLPLGSSSITPTVTQPTPCHLVAVHLTRRPDPNLRRTPATDPTSIEAAPATSSSALLNVTDFLRAADVGSSPLLNPDIMYFFLRLVLQSHLDGWILCLFLRFLLPNLFYF